MNWNNEFARIYTKFRSPLNPKPSPQFIKQIAVKGLLLLDFNIHSITVKSTKYNI